MIHRVPERLGWVVVPPTGADPVSVFLMHLPDGDPCALHGTGALIWVLAADGEPDVAGTLADLLDTPEEVVRPAVADFLVQLKASGFLEEAP